MDPVLELKNKLRDKKEEYKQAVERHEFLEQQAIQEEIEQLKIQWHQLTKGVS
ncbi:hypothetical protein GCM10011571_21300 [Marinithermofilum abyssi]|uniref:Uncharacterized protein n=1 Tax=Marinithermofilum abyssi TaxID=1571185 RepID=A0A8J2YAS9_9BACL|nr:hypothetical protein [Marinithermofilum abyssi]GGE19119.1 hypothetical protein GCM10011571_21300 [Marinithermofilum abyssi]